MGVFTPSVNVSKVSIPYSILIHYSRDKHNLCIPLGIENRNLGYTFLGRINECVGLTESG